MLRFEYITDDATSFTGLAIDAIEIPELGYRADASARGGWEAEGFGLAGQPLEQGFIVQKIEGPRDDPTVTRIQLDGQNRAEIPLAGATIIAISGITDNTAEKAPYSWELRAP
jgi:hypothetical protein